jgi:hypothetical protein
MYLTGAEVIAVKQNASSVEIKVKNQLFEGHDLNFVASDVSICTNGFLKEFFPEEDVWPKRG